MGLILDENRDLLVTTRKFDPGKGGLDLPGGFAEPGEGIQEALAREIKEELNLEVLSMAYFCSCFNSYPYEKVTYPVTDMAFVCTIKEFSFLRPADDVQAVTFVPIEKLEPDQFAMTSARQTIARFKTEFSGTKGPGENTCKQ